MDMEPSKEERRMLGYWRVNPREAESRVRKRVVRRGNLLSGDPGT
jgi:hypothetical protein